MTPPPSRTGARGAAHAAQRSEAAAQRQQQQRRHRPQLQLQLRSSRGGPRGPGAPRQRRDPGAAPHRHPGAAVPLSPSGARKGGGEGGRDRAELRPGNSGKAPGMWAGRGAAPRGGRAVKRTGHRGTAAPLGSPTTPIAQRLGGGSGQPQTPPHTERGGHQTHSSDTEVTTPAFIAQPGGTATPQRGAALQGAPHVRGVTAGRRPTEPHRAYGATPPGGTAHPRGDAASVG